MPPALRSNAVAGNGAGEIWASFVFDDSKFFRVGTLRVDHGRSGKLTETEISGSMNWRLHDFS